jgi:hypothetical protein
MSNPGNHTSRWATYINVGFDVLFSVSAISAALFVSHRPLFQSISGLISDQISQSVGVYSSGPFVLVRVDGKFTRPALQQLLARAIETLTDTYRATAVAVDINFSNRDYSQLAASFAKRVAGNPAGADKVIWAVGYERPQNLTPNRSEQQECGDCSDASCAHRFMPRPVFGTGIEPTAFGLSYASADASGVIRSSPRFGCLEDSTGRMPMMHFQLVSAYCRNRPQDQNCLRLNLSRQHVTQLFTRYDARSWDLCALVKCTGTDLGTPISSENPFDDLAGKIPILYANLEDNDDHATTFGARKGAEIIAALAMNELLHGESNEALMETLKWAAEIVLALTLIVLFHWQRTKASAVLISGFVFTAYWLIAPWFSRWIPDFRNYILAVGVGFILEAWLKASGVEGLLKAACLSFVRKTHRSKPDLQSGPGLP